VGEIAYSEIAAAAERLCIRARTWFPPDIVMGIECAADSEADESVRLELVNLLERTQTVTQENRDIGTPVLFADVGEAVTILDGTIETALQAGIGYAIEPTLHIRQVPGGQIALKVMFHTAQRIESNTVIDPAELADFAISAVRRAEIAVHAPVIVGIGLGNTLAESASLADYALARPIDRRNPNPVCAEAEWQIRTATGALAVNLEGQINSAGNACTLYISPPHLRRASCVI